MFTVKVVKKHGVPYGTPEVLAYVDPDAPGEAEVKYYQHLLTFSYGRTLLVNSDPTPFTESTFAKWLYDHGYTTGTKRFHSTTASLTNFNNSLHTLYIYKNIGQYSTDGVSIKAQFDQTSITVNEGALSGTSVASTSGTDSLNRDSITEII